MLGDGTRLTFLALVFYAVFFNLSIVRGSSMSPSIRDGDRILVEPWSYVFGSVSRGDVVVLKYPLDPSVDYIKRVIGLPGDTIVYRDHQLYINGQQMPLTKHPDTRLQDSALIFIEGLDGREHEIRISRPGSRSTERTYTVPEGQYFMMGDNRDNSQDSRFIGEIPETHLVGEAVRIWMHMDGLEWPAWNRIGTKIQ